jgi:hypothetical protein
MATAVAVRGCLLQVQASLGLVAGLFVAAHGSYSAIIAY